MIPAAEKIVSIFESRFNLLHDASNRGKKGDLRPTSEAYINRCYSLKMRTLADLVELIDHLKEIKNKLQGENK